jgi:DNA-directed RNA polymerase subunit RPC12/RpoP
MSIYKCVLCGEEFETVKEILIHVTKKHRQGKNGINHKQYYEKYLKENNKCIICGESIPFEKRFRKYCSDVHEKNHKLELKGELNYKCGICGFGFSKINQLAKHVNEKHDIKKEDYYKKYIWKEGEPDGKCKWCGNEIGFRNYHSGFKKFCNTTCTLNWQYQNTDRREKASERMIKISKENPEKFPYHVEYHIKRGCTLEEAKKKVQDRYNSFSKDQRKTTEQFILDARKVHGDTYDYSLVDYKTAKEKVKIICPIHGVFEQAPNSHLNGRECFDCKGIERLTKDEFIETARKVHGDTYDYSMVEYINSTTKVKIVCPIHGVFKLTPIAHTSNGARCQKCSKKHRYTTGEYIEEAKKVHGDTYDYSMVEYKTAKEKIKIKCSKHGVFEQTPSGHLSGRGCYLCKTSRGEEIIARLLEENQISFIRQKTYPDLLGSTKNKKKLSFDFHLDRYNINIEYDGEQHFQHIEGWISKESYERTVLYDKKKDEYCVYNNIKLLRIRYDEDIKEKLIDFLEDNGCI